MPSPYNAFTEPQPGVFAFTGPGVPPVTLTGPTAAAEAARLMPPAQNVSAPLASGSIMSEALPSAPAMTVAPRVERSVADVQPDMTGGMSGGISSAPPAAPSVTVDPSLEVSRAREPAGFSAAPREPVMSERPPASFAGDAPPREISRRIGPGGPGGAAGPVDASGGFLAAYNNEVLRRLTQRGGGSAGTKADAWQNQTRQTQVQDNRVGAIPMAGYLATVGSEGAANERVRQESEALDAQKLSAEADAEQKAAEAIAQMQHEARMKRQDLRTSMEAITNAAEEPDVDPGAWFANRGTMSNVLLGLSAASAGYFNGRAGITGPNPVIRNIEKAIERDVSVQIENRGARERGKQAKLQRLGQLYNMVKEETGDDVQAMNQAKVTALTIAQKQLQAQALQSDSPLAQARYDAAFAAIDKRKAEIVIENEKHLQVQKTGTEKFIPKGTGAGGGPDQLKLLREAAMTNKEFNPTGKAGEAPGEMVIGNKLVPLDPTLTPAEKQKGREGAAQLTRARAAFERAEQKRGMLGAGFGDADVLDEIRSGASHLSKARDMGVVTGGDWDIEKDLKRGVFGEKAIKSTLTDIDKHVETHELQYGANKREQLDERARRDAGK